MNLQEARDALITLRQRKNLTQTDVANNLNTSQASIARIENANAELTWKQVTRYASALGQKLTVSLVSAEPVLSLELGDVFQSAAGRSFLREHSCPDYVNITSPEGQAVQTIISGCVGIGKTHALARIAHLLRDKANIILADPRGEVFSYLQEMESPAVHALQIGRNGRGKGGVAFLGDTAVAEAVSYANRIGHTPSESPLPTIALVDDPANSESPEALADAMEDLADSGHVAGVIGTTTDEGRGIPSNGAAVRLERKGTRTCIIDVATDITNFDDLRQYACSAGTLPPVWLPAADASHIPQIIDAVSAATDVEALVLRGNRPGLSSDALLEHTPEAIAEEVLHFAQVFYGPLGRDEVRLRAHAQQDVAKATDAADLLKRQQRLSFRSLTADPIFPVLSDAACAVERELENPAYRLTNSAGLMANARKIMMRDTGRKALILDVQAEGADTVILEEILRTARSYNTLVIVVGELPDSARHNVRVLATS